LTPAPDTAFAFDDLLAPERWRPLVAVLPFTHRGDASLGLVGQEVADVLRERLESDPALQAILISSDFLAKAPPHAVDQVCGELRIGHVISGKCHGDPKNPSLYVELADTIGWNVQWAHFYQRSARSLLAPDGEPMAALVAALRHELLMHPRR
jgi:TolB-like protein